MKNLSRQKGFTLIELLASTFVIMVIGTIIISIMVSSLRGTNKVNTINTTRQNGTYAISQISKMLRFARSVDDIDNLPVANCVSNIPLPTPQPVHSAITFTSLDGGSTTLACDMTNHTIASNGASLLDYNYVQIPDNTCQITCYQQTNSDAIIIGIKFGLNATQPGSSLFSDFTASGSAIEFSTSIVLRNLGN